MRHVQVAAKKGDANGDNEITISEAVSILRYVAEIEQGELDSDATETAA